MKDYLYIDRDDDAHQAKFKVSKTPAIENLIKQEKYDEALDEINGILKDEFTYVNLNLKGIILNKMGQFKKSIECFDEALSFSQNDEFRSNKAHALYDWAKVSFFPEGNYDKALTLINCGLENVPDGEDPSEFYFLKAEILEGLNDLKESYKSYLIAYKEFDRLEEFKNQVNYLQNTQDTLINIVGSNFYEFTPESGVIVDLVRDEENEHDSDAVAVIVDGNTVGYVANNPYTLIDEVKSASDIKSMIGENQKAEILFIYLGEYVIAKLI
ncbi:MAG: hypothetical protein IJ258_10060 [Methanobrevibacter sp.]|uniref:HIRAN domain-containing protein n=1 Tax=Methanobrevibacter sp. TaxID=66852 RepID=UPI0025E42CCE|nr:HIRAN domain-containing protein [Methanobrevibacter sp.]MBQ8018430.1 hypothetical protein [Methanobrevibacter sp.]